MSTSNTMRRCTVTDNSKEAVALSGSLFSCGGNTECASARSSSLTITTVHSQRIDPHRNSELRSSNNRWGFSIPFARFTCDRNSSCGNRSGTPCIATIKRRCRFLRTLFLWNYGEVPEADSAGAGQSICERNKENRKNSGIV